MKNLKLRIWDGKDMLYFDTVNEWDVKDYNTISKLTRDNKPAMYSTTIINAENKEFYDGDIVYRKSTGTTGQVIFKEGEFIIKWQGMAGYVMFDSQIKTAFNDELKGNIYKNKNLLK